MKGDAVPPHLCHLSVQLPSGLKYNTSALTGFDLGAPTCELVDVLHLPVCSYAVDSRWIWM